MHFKFLSEVGHHYATETTVQLTHTNQRTFVTKPLRQVILTSLAADVLRAKTQYEQLDRDYRSQHAGQGVHATKVSSRIQARAAAFLQVAGGAASRAPVGGAVSAEEISRARGVYEAALRHFQNQGGVLANDGSLDWAASDQLVVYDRTLAEQDLTKLRIKGGRLYIDDAGTKLFDTTNLSTVFSKLGFAIYVMSEEGNIHSSTHAIGYKHHSSLLAAANTAGAGEMKVEKGELKWISNKSGHYTPAVQHFIQVLHFLQKKGIDLAAVRVQFHTASGKTDYNTVGDFLATLKPEEDYYHAKMIGYINSVPFTDIERTILGNGWRFPTSDEYTRLNLKGVLNAATGSLVPHKQVCQYLKGQHVPFNPIVRVGASDIKPRIQSGAGR